jgi:hypothetical protein
MVSQGREIRATVLAVGLLAAAGLACSSLVSAPAHAAKTIIISNTSSLTQSNETPRRTVLCPRRGNHKFPYGGAMSSTPYGLDGEGVYPHSYERLGVQHGYHVTPVMFDPTPPLTAARQVTLQAVCGPEPGKLTPPHVTKQVDPGEFATNTMVCPGRRTLIGGGFQRTDWVGPQQGAPTGGDFATQSQMIGPNVWQVSGTAIGLFGGELTGIAYCRHGKKPLLTTVSAETTIMPRSFGTATTPTCPVGRSLVFTGFNTQPRGSIFYAGGPLFTNQSTSGSGYNRSSATATLTVEGYCMNVQRRHG